MFRKIQSWFMRLINSNDTVIQKKEVTIHDRPEDRPEDNPFKSKAEKELKIQLFKDKNRKWRFRIVAANNKILCSSEAYSRKEWCEHTAELIKKASFVVVGE